MSTHSSASARLSKRKCFVQVQFNFQYFYKTMFHSSSFSTTFKVADKNPEEVKRSRKPETSICSQLKSYKKKHCTTVLTETPFTSTVEPTPINGFLQAVIDCYNRHHNLVIRPDDIWMALLTQFSFYINRHTDEFRNQFVYFDQKEMFSVTIDGSLRSAPYDFFVTKMIRKIDKNVVETMKDWILPKFSTTTKNDIISCGVALMATTKKYFQFLYVLGCGIPTVTLEGTEADWESIISRLEKLKS